MGLFGKIKDLFYDEDEQEDNKDVIKIEPDDKEEIEEIEEIEDKVKTVKEEVVENVKTENTYSERELFRSERTFNFNEFDDFANEPDPVRVTALDTNKFSRSIEPAIAVSPKQFKPSPVISPIYGILDKNYYLEDIVEKDKENNDRENTVKNYETIRKKAYGINDTFEDTFVNTPKEVKESINRIENEVEKLNDQTEKIENLINSMEDTNITIGELEDKYKEKEYDTNEFDTTVDDTLEHDLFNLIDSMYSDKEE